MYIVYVIETKPEYTVYVVKKIEFKEFYIISASSKYNFSNLKHALKFNYVVYFQSSMTTCNKLNYFININWVCAWLNFFPLLKTCKSVCQNLFHLAVMQEPM